MTQEYKTYLESEIKLRKANIDRIVNKEIRYAKHDIIPTWEELKELNERKLAEAEYNLQQEFQLFI